VRDITHLVAWIIMCDLGGLWGWSLVIGRTVSFDSPMNVFPNFFWSINELITFEELCNCLKHSTHKLGLPAVDSFISLICHCLLSVSNQHNMQYFTLTHVSWWSPGKVQVTTRHSR